MSDKMTRGPWKDLTGQRFGKLEVLGPAGSRSGRTAWRCRCDCGEETVVLGLNLVAGRTKSCGCVGARLDLAGQRFGKLTAMEPAANVGGCTAWKCVCDCGNEVVVKTNDLRSGKKRSCGCDKRPRLDLTGDRYGKLTVLGRAPDVGGQAAWLCHCDCGNDAVVRMSDLRSGNTKSCGCEKARLDLSGQRFGKLTAMEPAANVGRRTAWKCVCDCGNEVVVKTDELRSGKKRSCGCDKRPRLDLAGDRYGKLTVLGRAPDIGGQAAWLCHCDCGNDTIVRMGSLRSGNTRSCGCLRRDMMKDRGYRHEHVSAEA